MLCFYAATILSYFFNALESGDCRLFHHDFILPCHHLYFGRAEEAMHITRAHISLDALSTAIFSMTLMMLLFSYFLDNSLPHLKVQCTAMPFGDLRHRASPSRPASSRAAQVAARPRARPIWRRRFNGGISPSISFDARAESSSRCA